MISRVDEIAAGIYRLSTYVPEVGPTGFTFNQFLIDTEEPVIYHTGMRSLFPVVKGLVQQVMPVERLRWIAFSHVEADECGAVNEFLAAAPHAQVAHGVLGVNVSLNDLCDRPPRALADDEVVELGALRMEPRRLQHLDTPHVPHNWESRAVFEQTTRTLFCGDLLTQSGNGPAVTAESLIDAAMAAEDVFHQHSLGPALPATLRRLADLEPTTLAVMHGSSFSGDGGAVLRALAEAFEQAYPQTKALAAAAS